MCGGTLGEADSALPQITVPALVVAPGSAVATTAG